MENKKNDRQVTQQMENNAEMQRLVKWVSSHWDEWKMLCNPAITETDTRTKRRKWIEALKSFAKADFPALILVFMTKCYYMGNEAKQVVEEVIARRILTTWDENAINDFTNCLSKIDIWNARKLPNTDEMEALLETTDKAEIERFLNPEKR